MSHCTVISPYKFSVCDTTGEDSYTGGGLVLQVKTPVSLAFVSKTFYVTGGAPSVWDSCRISVDLLTFQSSFSA